MSEIKVNSIKGVAASTAALTINNTDGTCTANITNNLSNRNLIINGAMQVAQRGTSSTSTGYQTVDRFHPFHTGTDEAPTYAQVDVASGTTPYTLGFRKAFKITNGNQTSGAGAADAIEILYRNEAQNIANSGWNYTSASSFITLSYWVKSSVAQNFFGHIQSHDGTSQNYPFETGSLTADTWTKITKTIPGNSNLTFDNDNNSGFTIKLLAFRGTNTTGSVSLNAWAAYNGAARTPDNTSTWYTTNDATLELTGFQLEVSDHATDFEHRSFGQELALCQRYYAKYQGTAYSIFIVTTGYGSNETDSRGVFNFITEMRTNSPSFTYSSSSHFQDMSGKQLNIFQLADSGATTKYAGIRTIFSQSFADQGKSYVIRGANTTSAYFAFDSEL